MSDAMPTKVWLHDDGWYTERQPSPEDKWRLPEYRRADLVDAEIERLRSENEGYATSYDALSAELAAERQRARMPDELVKRLRERLEHHRVIHTYRGTDELLIRDLLAWHEQEKRNE